MAQASNTGSQSSFDPFQNAQVKVTGLVDLVTYTFIR